MRFFIILSGVGLAVILTQVASSPSSEEAVEPQAASPLASLSTPGEVEKFLIEKSRVLSDRAAMNRWMEEVGFITTFNIFPPGHFRAGESEIIAYWPADQYGSKTPFGGIYFTLRELNPSSGVVLHIKFGSNDIVDDVSLSFPSK